MKKKLILSGRNGKRVQADIATMKGSTITVDDFYNQIKEQSTSQHKPNGLKSLKNMATK